LLEIQLSHTPQCIDESKRDTRVTSRVQRARLLKRQALPGRQAIIKFLLLMKSFIEKHDPITNLALGGGKRLAKKPQVRTGGRSRLVPAVTPYMIRSIQQSTSTTGNQASLGGQRSRQPCRPE